MKKMTSSLYFGVCGMILSPLFAYLFSGRFGFYGLAIVALAGLIGGLILGWLFRNSFADLRKTNPYSYRRSALGGLGVGLLAGFLTGFFAGFGFVLYPMFEGNRTFSVLAMFQTGLAYGMGGFFFGWVMTPFTILLALLLTKIQKASKN